MKLYNSLTRKIEEFKPISSKKVGIYSCGPTVYWNQHIGHMYAYVQWDVLTRYLKFLGYEVDWVMNITDVGHMTSDEDAGEDKMEKGAEREGISVEEVASRYTKQFLESLDLLNIKRPNVLCRATEHIQEQIALIKKIEANGFTYKTKMGLVFDTQKFAGYNKFARLDLKKLKTGSRQEVDPEKKVPWDFFLWVTGRPKHTMRWESPWGVGFPGWHIECTAMSTKYLGSKFDIHTGGIEHIPVHHTNEIAQGHGAFGDQTANYWLHNAWLMSQGEQKMSKSLGNFVTVQSLVEKGCDPLALRYLILTSHYRKGLNFSLESLSSAQKALGKLMSQVQVLKTQVQRTMLSAEKEKKIQKYSQRFQESMSNDLNTPQALAIIWEVLKSNIPSEDKYDLAVSFNEVFGLRLAQVPGVKYQVSGELQKLIEEREKKRSEADYMAADKLREEIVKKFPVKLKDAAAGTVVEPVRNEK
jgi:cysteinyl-tRNA synthetase